MQELEDERLNEYLDGELDEAARAEVEAWLAQSAAARTRLAELKGLFAALTAVTNIPLTTDLTPSVLAAMRRSEVAPASWWLRFLPLAQLAAAAVLVILFWTTLQTWWQHGRSLLLQLLPAVQLPELALGERMVEWVTAVWQNMQITPPQFDLATGQWAILAGLALVVWLLGNRLLFTQPFTQPFTNSNGVNENR
jgi:anti-sigma factor RsiW